MYDNYKNDIFPIIDIETNIDTYNEILNNLFAKFRDNSKYDNLINGIDSLINGIILTNLHFNTYTTEKYKANIYSYPEYNVIIYQLITSYIDDDYYKLKLEDFPNFTPFLI
jgi:hypothetical protein